MTSTSFITTKTEKTTGSMNDFLDALRKDGYRKLGQGCYGVVMAKPGSELVMKIGRVGNNAPYIAWIKEVIKQGRRPDLPMVYSYTEMTPDYHAPFFVVIMERLDDAREYVSENDKRRKWYIDLGDEVERASNKIDNGGQVPKLKSDLAAIIVNAYKAAVSVQRFVGVDMHYGNIMRRGDQLVITDPLS